VRASNEVDQLRKRIRARMNETIATCFHHINGLKRRIDMEHPFGTIKSWMNQGYLLLKGLEKVRGEFGFSVIAYNMKRAISVKSVRALIQAL
jgi:hypothetical protein